MFAFVVATAAASACDVKDVRWVVKEQCELIWSSPSPRVDELHDKCMQLTGWGWFVSKCPVIVDDSATSGESVIYSCSPT